MPQILYKPLSFSQSVSVSQASIPKKLTDSINPTKIASFCLLLPHAVRGDGPELG
jgi:hypothetical protein